MWGDTFLGSIPHGKNTFLRLEFLKNKELATLVTKLEDHWSNHLQFPKLIMFQFKTSLYYGSFINWCTFILKYTHSQKSSTIDDDDILKIFDLLAILRNYDDISYGIENIEKQIELMKKIKISDTLENTFNTKSEFDAEIERIRSIKLSNPTSFKENEFNDFDVDIIALIVRYHELTKSLLIKNKHLYNMLTNGNTEAQLEWMIEKVMVKFLQNVKVNEDGQIINNIGIPIINDQLYGLIYSRYVSSQSFSLNPVELYKQSMNDKTIICRNAELGKMILVAHAINWDASKKGKGKDGDTFFSILNDGKINMGGGIYEKGVYTVINLEKYTHEDKPPAIYPGDIWFIFSVAVLDYIEWVTNVTTDGSGVKTRNKLFNNYNFTPTSFSNTSTELPLWGIFQEDLPLDFLEEIWVRDSDLYFKITKDLEKDENIKISKYKDYLRVKPDSIDRYYDKFCLNKMSIK